MKIIIPPKCKVELFNPNDEPVIVRTTKVRVTVGVANNTDVEVRPDKGKDDEVIWLK